MMHAKRSSKDVSLEEDLDNLRRWTEEVLEQIQVRLMAIENEVTTANSTSDVQNELLTELSRCLIAIGQGQEFSAVVDVAIEDYATIRHELKELTHLKLSRNVRPLVETCLSQVLTRFHLALSRIGVSVHEVEAGAALDLEHHEVVEHAETDDQLKLESICECLQPEFRWSSRVERFRRAKVVAFTKLTTSSDGSHDDKSKGADLASYRSW